jgi:hypothetical protein
MYSSINSHELSCICVFGSHELSCVCVFGSHELSCICVLGSHELSCICVFGSHELSCICVFGSHELSCICVFGSHELSCICVFGVHILPLLLRFFKVAPVIYHKPINPYAFYIWFWKHSDSVLFCAFQLYLYILYRYYAIGQGVVISNSLKIKLAFWNSNICVVYFSYLYQIIFVSFSIKILLI